LLKPGILFVETLYFICYNHVLYLLKPGIFAFYWLKPCILLVKSWYFIG